MTRRVVIVRDTASPLWVLRCVKPCGASGDGEWCMRGPDGRHPPHCYLGSGLSQDGAAAVAARWRYEVMT